MPLIILAQSVLARIAVIRMLHEPPLLFEAEFVIGRGGKKGLAQSLEATHAAKGNKHFLALPFYISPLENDEYEAELPSVID